MAINAQDILDTLANSVTHSTLTPGAAANAGASSKGQEVNAYAKAMKIIKQNSTYINNQSTQDTATADAIEEIFFGHQYQAASPYSKSGTGSYTGNVVEGNNTANGFNALFLANAIDQFRQIDSAGASPISAGTDINSTHYQLTQAQGSGNMTITLLDSEAATPTATSGVSFQFRKRGGGTAAAGLILGTTEIGRATSATTLTLDSGAELGMTNNGGDSTAQEATLYLYAINNGGTIELGVINGQQLDESILHSSTVLNGSADSAGVLYSDTARTSLAVRLIGRMRLSRNDVTTFDEDPNELAIIGIGGASGGGELGAGEKINWVDSSVFIQGANNSITIDADDNFTLNTDTLVSINSTTKNQLTAPTTNVISTTAIDANTPLFTVRSATDNRPIVTIQNDHDGSGGPVLRLTNNRVGDGQDNDQAGRIEFRSKDDGTPSEAIFVQQFANVADASTSSKDGKWTLQVMSADTLTNRLIANSTGVGVTGNLAITGNMTVSGTTTTINSTVSTLKDPIFAIGTDDDGAAPGSDDNKDRGILMHYYSGTAKTAFMGWDESAAEMALAKTVTLSSEALDGTTVYANTHVGAQLKLGSGVAEDTMVVFDGNATDIRMGIDDSSDLFEIGTGAAHDTTAAITVDTSQNVNIVAHDAVDQGLKLAGTLVTSTAAELNILDGCNTTAAELNLLDGSAKSTSSITIAASDAFIVIDGTTTKQIPASDVLTYAGFSGALTSDMTIFDDQNNADTSLSIGTSGTEALVISVLNGASNKTAESISFTSKTASSTANTGMMTFSVDEATAQLTIHDGGINATTISETSSRELKTNITPMSNSLDKIMALQGVNFDWKDGRGGKQIGLIADDVADVVPEVVQFNHTSPTSLQYSKMVALLIEGMKEQQTEIDKLKKLVSKSK